ncbi:histidinol-phosphate transaminase [Parendozoicomonas haliclonae]|uniref:histidinol-phosphate transaminase n=1 Tax=Parendozoicomonas haliclonae TaxID=1960125 RepID=UPI001F611A4D|nr:histidinol-phosphate transaminase [Parendozoicomonas haliclonae]
MSCDFAQQTTPGVSRLKPYQPGKPISELARELGLDEKAIVKLASNENPLGPSEKVVATLQSECADLARYPDGSGYQLKQALAAKLSVDPQGITLGNGSNDVLDLIVRAWVSPGDEVVFSEHAFAVYPISTLAASGQPVQVPAKDYGHDLVAMAAAITDKTRVVFIANPNNPTGNWLDRDALKTFLQSVPERVLVVLDEAYCEYIDHPDYPNGLDWLADYPNLVVTRTFSKIYGLASLRVGYSVSSVAIAEVLNRVRQPFNVNSFALAAAVAALADEDYVARSKAMNTDGLRQLEQGLDVLGLSYIPSLGNFITFDTGHNGEQVYQTLLKRGVIVRPVTGYGLPAHLRVSVGTPEENQAFLDALPAALSEVAAL